jgi:flagellar biosynthesis chaperone FliJ
MPHYQQHRFLEALNGAQQSHIAAYVKANGVYAAKDGDNWPLFASDKFILLQRSLEKLTDIIDVNCGLLDELFGEGVINNQQIRTMKNDQSELRRNRELLEIMLRKSVGNFNRFIECLQRTNQHAAVSLLAPDVTNIQLPLSEEVKQNLLRQRALLVIHIDSRNGLLQKLYACDGITRRQKEFIESAVSEEETNERLLKILIGGSEINYNKFIDCLNETTQGNLANILNSQPATTEDMSTITGAIACASSEEERKGDNFNDREDQKRAIFQSLLSQRLLEIAEEYDQHIFI